jgi:phosphatidate cytidylyltransferase
MHSKNKSAQFGLALVAALGFLASFFLGDLTRLVYVLLIVGVVMVGQMRSSLVCIVATIAVVEIALMLEEFNWITGLLWTLWLIAVVAATDIGGYFAGKFIGGPKILPRISPKKTWSGTVGGWVLAILVSALYVYLGYGSVMLLPATLFVAIASQIGDMIESSMKRRAGVKDASNLIPGHGGLLDRFDGLLGATLVVGILSNLGLLPVLGLVG